MLADDALTEAPGFDTADARFDARRDLDEHFMLDDIIVFVAAMVTLQMMGVTTRYKRLSNLIGGVLMLLIGLLLIFKPGWLMFG